MYLLHFLYELLPIILHDDDDRHHQNHHCSVYGESVSNKARTTKQPKSHTSNTANDDVTN